MSTLSECCLASRGICRSQDEGSHNVCHAQVIYISYIIWSILICHAHVTYTIIWYDICPGNMWSLLWWCWCWRASVMIMVVNKKELLSFKSKEKIWYTGKIRENQENSVGDLQNWGDFARKSIVSEGWNDFCMGTEDNIPLKRQLIAGMLACWTLLLPCSLSIKCQTSSTAIYPLTPCYKAI